MATYSGSFQSSGTPTLEAFTPRFAETWRGSDKAARKAAGGSCYSYITQSDGTVLKVPFLPPRAERNTRKVAAAVTKNSTRLDRSEAARLAPIEHDYTSQ